jgi:hypothetical protein
MDSQARKTTRGKTTLTNSMRTKHLTHAVFATSLNSNFEVILEKSRALRLKLSEVSDLLESPTQQRFSVIFRGPQSRFLPQGLYKMKHKKIGTVDLFIVPVGVDEEGFSYEAVFNYLLTTKEKKRTAGVKRPRKKKSRREGK